MVLSAAAFEEKDNMLAANMISTSIFFIELPLIFSDIEIKYITISTKFINILDLHFFYLLVSLALKQPE
tara:strand:- start:486 stop:692 length:207 start_codon:yes stop_codon:yes gene_type:complete